MADGRVEIDVNVNSSQVQPAMNSAVNSVRRAASEMSNASADMAEPFERAVQGSADASGAVNGMSGQMAEAFRSFSEQAITRMDMLNSSLLSIETTLGEISDASDNASGSVNKFSALKGVLKGIGAAAVAAGTAAFALGKSAVSAYADYEQLVGGVETLFGAGGQSLEEYAESQGKSVEKVKAEYESLMSAQSAVFANADQAFKTAGLSANAYMETVTGFSASLVASLGGDTLAAAEKADMAIVDMADNANKMGSDMESIQNAYQGFAKQNYTINLMSAA